MFRRRLPNILFITWTLVGRCQNLIQNHCSCNHCSCFWISLNPGMIFMFPVLTNSSPNSRSRQFDVCSENFCMLLETFRKIYKKIPPIEFFFRKLLGLGFYHYYKKTPSLVFSCIFCEKFLGQLFYFYRIPSCDHLGYFNEMK